jgi:hypothetical protein
MLSQGNSTLKYTLKSWQVTYKAPTLFGPFPCTEITKNENAILYKRAILPRTIMATL